MKKLATRKKILAGKGLNISTYYKQVQIRDCSLAQNHRIVRVGKDQPVIQPTPPASRVT